MKLYIWVRWRLSVIRERAWIKLAWAMPRNLAYWCALRVIAHATQGRYENQIVPDLNVMDALKRWDVK